MKTFKDFKHRIELLKEKEEKHPSVENDSKKLKSSNINVDDVKKSKKASTKTKWIKDSMGWKAIFNYNEELYILALSPLDPAKKHWKFTYFRQGEKNSSDINKFGTIDDWVNIWEIIFDTLKEFIRIYQPHTLKFIGMTISKRSNYYKELFQLLHSNLKNYFKDVNYITSFDLGDLSLSPSLSIRKNISEKQDGKKNNNEKIAK